MKAKSLIKAFNFHFFGKQKLDVAAKLRVLFFCAVSIFLFLYCSSIAGRNILSLALANYGFYLNSTKQWSASIATFNTVNWLANGKNACAYFGKAYAEEQTGRFNSALRDYKIAVSIDPKNACIYNNLALAHEALSQQNLALTAYDKSVALNPRHAAHLIDRGKLFNSNGHAQQARKDFLAADVLADKELKDNPFDSGNLADKAYTLYELGLSSEALQKVDKAIKNTPDDLDQYFLRAIILLALKQPQQADKDINLYLSRNPFDQEAYLYSAKIKAACGNLRTASLDRLIADQIKQYAKNSS